jgi:CO/xanthine dehydrogenase FAD-binding subunit
MRAASFRYVRPESVDEALDVLGELGDEAAVLAGGQSLVPMLSMRLANPETLIDIGRLEGLAGVEAGPDGTVTVGALTTHRELELARLDGAGVVWSRVASGIGHLPIRMLGTFGGSVAHGDPAADLPVLVRALDGEVVTRSRRGERVVPAAEFFVMPLVTAKKPDELVVQVRVVGPPPRRRTGAAYQKFSRRAGDFAVVSAFARVAVDDAGAIVEARVGMGGVAGVPVRSVVCEQRLTGSRGEEAVVAEAAELAARELQPSGDVHASASFRRHLVGVLLRRVIRTALVEAEQGPDEAWEGRRR